MGPKEVFETLKARFGEAVEWKEGHAGEPYAIVDAGKIVEVSRFLRETHTLEFDCLSNLTGVDLLKLKMERIAVVYHLFSYSQRHSFVMKVHLDRTAPTVSTVNGVWRAAAYMEREVWDLLGVKFDGHPDLRRILLPEDWVGHPLRKDYQEQATYQGIPTTRPNPLELIPLGVAEEQRQKEIATAEVKA